MYYYVDSTVYKWNQWGEILEDLLESDVLSKETTAYLVSFSSTSVIFHLCIKTCHNNYINESH